MTIVIYGPGRTGKTLHAHRFAKHYGCTRILEIDSIFNYGDLLRPTEDGTDYLIDDRYCDILPGAGQRCLILCQDIHAILWGWPRPNSKAIPVQEARAAVGLEPIPEGGFPLSAATDRPTGKLSLALGVTVKQPTFYYSLAANLEDAETWYGPHASRSDAIMAAQAKTDEAFWTAIGKPMEHDLSIFTPAMAAEDGAIATAFDDRNGQNLGEDGESGPTWWTEDHVRDLIDRLNATFSAWAKDHGYHRAWMLDVTDECRVERGSR
ncbi:ATP-binding protein [Sphingomonas sp.]|uniref:ATP-binding protein n=1 Tax=Sphingomonas sp. TaxID=28214 RepID=UPI0031D78D01